MVTIAIDAMGGDNAPEAPVSGAVQGVKAREDLEVVLYGVEEQIQAVLDKLDYPSDRVAVRHCEQVIHGDDQPVMAIRRKQESSLVQAIKAVKEGEAQGVLSAGNTGALMAGSVLYIGRMPGIERPALSAIFPTFSGGSITVLDVGANMDPSPEHLLTYSRMGRLFSKWVLGVESPRVGLLNVGTESNKGNTVTKAAFELFQTEEPNFAGNTEARDLLQGPVDVLVCDGFTGNVMLKTIEGAASGLFSALKAGITSGGLRSKLGGALLLPSLKGLKSSFDQEDQGGAPLLGVAGAVIKAHGSSSARGIQNTLLKQAYPFVHNGLLDKISREIGE